MKDIGPVNNSKERDRFEALGSIVKVINSSREIEHVLELIMDNAMELMEAERGFIMLVDPCADRLEFKVARNIERKKLESDELEISRTIVQEVYSSKKAMLTHNAAQDPRFMDNPSVRAFGLRSVISVPLIVKGECLGVIYLDNRFKLGIFNENDLEFMKIFADEIALAMENARLEDEKALIKNLFKHYVSPEVAEEVITRGAEFNLKGEKKVVTIFFVDIRGFSSLSEKIAPLDLVAQLNEYNQEMVRIIFRHRGTLLKFLGDGIMVAFGAPLSEEDDARRAVRAGLEMIEKLALLNEKWEKEGKPLFKIGIGMNTGETLVGIIGCYERREYSVIGDVPNTAARLEKLNKEYGSTFIVSDATYRQARDVCQAESLGTIYLEGKKEAVSVYKVV